MAVMFPISELSLALRARLGKMIKKGRIVFRRVRGVCAPAVFAQLSNEACCTVVVARLKVLEKVSTISIEILPVQLRFLQCTLPGPGVTNHE